MTWRGKSSYDEPFTWWGPTWASPVLRSISDLILEGTLTPVAAGLLWTLMARRASILVTAGPSGAGKTTLLTALLDFLPTGTRRIYVRGCYEPFHFLTDAAIEPQRTALLVNEISPHLPSYLWGPGVRRLLNAKDNGFLLAATAHATSVEDLVGSLSGYPLRVPPAEIAAFDLVVLLDAWEERGKVRREVAEVVALTPVGGSGGVQVDRLLRREARGVDGAPDVPADTPVLIRLRLGAESFKREVAERADALAGLAAKGVMGPEGLATLQALGERWLPGDGSG